MTMAEIPNIPHDKTWCEAFEGKLMQQENRLVGTVKPPNKRPGAFASFRAIKTTFSPSMGFLSPVATKLRKGDIVLPSVRPSVRPSVSPSVRLE